MSTRIFSVIIGILVALLAVIAGCSGGASSNQQQVQGATIQGKVTSLNAQVAKKAAKPSAGKLPSISPSSTNSSQNSSNRLQEKSVASSASGGTPVVGATCTVEGTDKSDITDQNGSFSINGVSPGSHILICNKALSDGTTYAFLKLIEVAGSQTLDIGSIGITPAGKIQGIATLTGQTDSSGIKAYIPGTSLQALTDATGAYMISNVPEGTYELRFERDGYSTTTFPNNVVTAGQTRVVGNTVLNISTGASGSMLIANGSPYSTSRSVSIAITASTNASLMMISENVSFLNSTWQPITSSANYTFSSDGQKRLYIKFSDANGLESAPVSNDIIIDTVPPTGGTISINAGAPSTNTSSVTLSFSASDASTSVNQMMVSNSAFFFGATWEDANSTKSWALSSGDGTKTVYVKFKDLVGNESNAISASIMLDTQSPTNAGGSILEGAFTNNRSINISLTASGATQIKISEDPYFSSASSSPYSSTVPFTLSTGNGSKTVFVRYLDDTGNATDFSLNPIVLDTTIPTTPVIFNQSQTTNLTTFTMTLSSTSNDENFKTYQLKGGQYADWTDTAEIGPFSFTLTQQGTNTLSVRGKDLAGNVGNSASLTVNMDTTAPIISNIVVSAQGTSATISWSTDEQTNGKIDYGLNTGYGSSKLDANTTTSHTVTLTGLSESTTYNYRISSTDSANNSTASSNLTFKTGREVYGNITSNTTWLATGGPYIVTGDVGIPSGVTLTIEAGTLIQYAGAYTMLVKGGVIANGTGSAPITFTTVAGLINSGATQLKFQETNLSNSLLSYVVMEKASTSIIIFSAGDPYNCPSGPDNTGVLNVSNATISASVKTGSCSDNSLNANGLQIFNSQISDTSIEGLYPLSANITIANSTIKNAAVTAHAYHKKGLVIKNTNASNSTFSVGCCSALMRLEGTTVTSSTFNQASDSQPGYDNYLQIASSSTLNNSNIYMPVSTTNITDTTINYSNNISQGIITTGNGSIDHVTITGNASATCVERGPSVYSYDNTSTLAISNSDFNSCGNAVKINGTGSGSVTISNNNFYSTTNYAVYNNFGSSVNATNNYWGTINTSSIDLLIYDAKDNLNYGIVTYAPIMNAPNVGTGPR